MVARNSSLRGMRKVQGVASHWKPLEVETRAPGGSLVTVNSWLEPRVMVAQAGSDSATPTSASARAPKRTERLEIMKAPRRLQVRPPADLKPLSHCDHAPSIIGA